VRKTPQAVGAVVVGGDGRVLLIRRARPPSVGSFTLPGGRVEKDEPLEAAVLREVFEETALRVRVVCSLGVVSIAREGFAYDIHEYLVVPVGNMPLCAGDDADVARWASAEDVAALGVRAEAALVIERGIREARLRGLIG
jgi:acetyl-CoA carboxylase carboxyl transferase subunit beta